MIKTFDENNKIGDIVTAFPGASDVFYTYHIDFCCGGHRSLKDAIEEQKLEGKQLLVEINQKYENFIEQNNHFMDWAKESPQKLINHIINTHHAYLREEMPKLSEYLFKILKVHGKSHKELFKVHKLFNVLRTELEGHMVKEEEYLFPMLLKLDQEPELRVEMDQLRNEVEQEHTGAGDILKELREVTDHYTIPEGVCKTFEITYVKLKELEQDLFQHIHLENNILFSGYANEKECNHMNNFSAQIDVRPLPPKEKHPRIFETFDHLKEGETMELINDHDPKPLQYQFSAERPDHFTWQYIEEGPDVWRVAISKK